MGREGVKQPGISERTVQTQSKPASRRLVNTFISSHPILQLQQSVGNQAVMRFLRSCMVHPKLRISQSGDKCEQEADRVAEQMMQAHGSQAQRQAKTGEESTQPEPLSDQMTSLVQGCKVSGEEEVYPEIEASVERARGHGQALDTHVREQMESAFHADFSGVRVHTDPGAVALNQALDARAFTAGWDIFFHDGEYNPGSSDGRGLLAHELTHVAQQAGGEHTEPTLSQPVDRYREPASQEGFVGRQVKEEHVEEKRGQAQKEEQESDERKKKQYEVPGHPKSPLSLVEIEKWLGIEEGGIVKAAKNREDLQPYVAQFENSEYTVPVVFPEKKIEHYGARGSRKLVRLKGGTFLGGKTTFVASSSQNDNLLIEYLEGPKLWIVHSYSGPKFENRIAELIFNDPKLGELLQKSVVE